MHKLEHEWHLNGTRESWLENYVNIPVCMDYSMSEIRVLNRYFPRSSFETELTPEIDNKHSLRLRLFLLIGESVTPLKSNETLIAVLRQFIQQFLPISLELWLPCSQLLQKTLNWLWRTHLLALHRIAKTNENWDFRTSINFYTENGNFVDFSVKLQTNEISVSDLIWRKRFFALLPLTRYQQKGIKTIPYLRIIVWQFSVGFGCLEWRFPT